MGSLRRRAAASVRAAIITLAPPPKDVVRGPGVSTFDLTVFKNIPLGGNRRRLQLRWEVYNLFNHTQFNGIDTTARFDAAGGQVNTRFGQVISTRTPRVMQAAIRVVF